MTAGANLLNVAVAYERLAASERAHDEITVVLRNSAAGDPFREALVRALVAPRRPARSWRRRCTCARCGSG